MFNCRITVAFFSSEYIAGCQQLFCLCWTHQTSRSQFVYANIITCKIREEHESKLYLVTVATNLHWQVQPQHSNPGLEFTSRDIIIDGEYFFKEQAEFMVLKDDGPYCVLCKKNAAYNHMISHGHANKLKDVAWVRNRQHKWPHPTEPYHLRQLRQWMRAQYDAEQGTTT